MPRLRYVTCTGMLSCELKVEPAIEMVISSGPGPACGRAAPAACAAPPSSQLSGLVHTSISDPSIGSPSSSSRPSSGSKWRSPPKRSRSNCFPSSPAVSSGPSGAVLSFAPGCFLTSSFQCAVSCRMVEANRRTMSFFCSGLLSSQNSQILLFRTISSSGLSPAVLSPLYSPFVWESSLQSRSPVLISGPLPSANSSRRSAPGWLTLPYALCPAEERATSLASCRALKKQSLLRFSRSIRDSVHGP